MLTIEKEAKLLDYIKDVMLNNQRLPNVITKKLQLDNDVSRLISTENMYRFVYTGLIEVKLKLYFLLSFKRHKKHISSKRREQIFISQMFTSHEREVIAFYKQKLGHFKTNLTIYQGTQSMNVRSYSTQKITSMLYPSQESTKPKVGLLKQIKKLLQNMRKMLIMDNEKAIAGEVSYRLAVFKIFSVVHVDQSKSY